MPPLWKVRREIRRLFRRPSFEGFKTEVGDLLFRLRYSDNDKDRWITIGQAAASDKVAVFLIFPSSGLLASHFHTLKYLRASGLSTLLVSNLPLSPDDLDALRPYCWKILQRPNLGYDFGGYREGILEAYETTPDLSEIFILNDSAWFPLNQDEDWLTIARSSGDDVVAVTDANGAVINTGAGDWANARWG